MFKPIILTFVFLAAALSFTPAQAETHAHELAMKIVDSDKAYEAFDNYVSKFEEGQESFADQMVASSANPDDLKRQLPLMLKLKLKLLGEMRAEAPEIYAGILMDKFSEKEMELLLNSTESKAEYKVYVASSAFPKAMQLATTFDQLGIAKINAKFQKRLRDQAFIKECARALVADKNSATN